MIDDTLNASQLADYLRLPLATLDVLSRHVLFPKPWLSFGDFKTWRRSEIDTFLMYVRGTDLSALVQTMSEPDRPVPRRRSEPVILTQDEITDEDLDPEWFTGEAELLDDESDDAAQWLANKHTGEAA